MKLIKNTFEKLKSINNIQHLKISCLIIILFFLPKFILGQTDSAETKRFGIIGSADCTYSFHDKVLSPGIGRKWTVGLSFTNKKRQFLTYISIGAKGFKINLYSPTFRESFLQDVKQNYVPINDSTEANAIAKKMYSSNGKSLSGTYSQYIEVGFILNKKFKPSFSFYYGNEEFLLHDRSFEHFEDPEHGDIDYVGMSTTFYEFKIGFAIPIKLFSNKPYCLDLNAGYKWVDYGSVKFADTPLSAYTHGSVAEKYSKTGKITLSLSYMFWSNWE